MIVDRVVALARGLENPKHPLLGPNLQGLYFFGLWHKSNKTRNILFNVFHTACCLFVISQFYALYLMKNDFIQVLLNFSLTAVSLISISKNIRTVCYQRRWNEIYCMISKEEISNLKKGELKIQKLMKDYIVYARVVTYLYWSTAVVTCIALLISPFLKFATDPIYRELVHNGTEPYPQILCSWYPFDNTKMPGYFFGMFWHVIITIQGAGVIAVFDMNAVSIMTFLKGQLKILHYKCEIIFENNTSSSNSVEINIKECFRLHSFLTNVVQLSLDKLGLSQKLLVLEYTVALVSSWVDRGVFNSNWWVGDVKKRRLLLLLAGKMSNPFIFKAGPFTVLSVQTFVDIMKGSYSFYTLFTCVDESTE
ncbi:unnamed protein product [Leptidea sinapis]|uniref:Odorant receptor n=1 Tax=Leptidea sinapis TaxID=189913 RepID=A0A5E4QZK3_9NEOP|nr:unnamed protein product [Leptidea sinapis]